MMKTPNLMLLWLLGLVLIGGSVTMPRAAMTSYQQRVYAQCGFTMYPDLCVRTLMESKDDPDGFMSALVNKTISESKLPNSYFDIPSYQLEALETQRSESVTGHCTGLMSMSLKRLDKSLLALKESARKNKQDIQTWISAALTFQEACKESADSSGLPSELTQHISKKMDYLAQLGSNLLALVNKITDSNNRNDKELEPKIGTKNSRHGDFPGWISVRDRKLLQSTTIKANAVVAKDGTGDYETISAAINAASGKRFVIYVKSGVYKEKIHAKKDGITLVGDGKYSTIITGDDSVGGRSSMAGSATFTVTGDGFIARDIGFQNTAGPEGQQALAIYVASDQSVLYRCSIAGYQDTVYAVALRQFYRECDIYGTIDFIFGNAAAVFQNCYIVLRRPRHGSSYNVIIAQGRTDPGQNTGFVLQNCKITAGTDYSPIKHGVSSYLGRPWKQYSRAVVMESSIDDAVSSGGWVEWPGAGSYAKTLYFAEYANTGPGASTSQRVNWPGFHVIGAQEAAKFTVGNFVSGTSWLPSTGVTFDSGL